MTPAANMPGMTKSRDRTNVYILLLAILVAAIAGYYLPTKRPETGLDDAEGIHRTG